jgi:DNA-binding MarR family transcriptional regulator
MDFGILLGTAYVAFVDELNVHLAERGFDDIGTHFGYVFRALDDGPATATQLAQRLGVTPQATALIVDDMVARGYVERTVSQLDRRARDLQLAERGLAALATAKRFHRRYEQRLAKRLGAADVATTRAVLEVIASAGAEPRRLRPL